MATEGIENQSKYSFIVPLAPQSAERPRTSFKTKTVTLSRQYANWRRDFDAWFDAFLQATDYDFIRFLLGRNKTIRTVTGAPRDENGKLRGSLQPTFNGYAVKAYFYSERPAGTDSDRVFNVSTPDGDNLFKAVTDGLFAHEAMYEAGMNDSYIVSETVVKMYAKPDEEPYIYLEFERMGG